MISVVIPAYRAEKSIASAIESVLAQDTGGRELEIVVVVDGGSDGTLAEARRAAKETAGPGRVRVLEQKNAGPAAARNAGIGAARGEIVAFLDADDRWLPGKLAAQTAVLEADTGIDLVGCTKNGFRYRGKKRLFEPGFGALLKRNYFATSGVMARKAALEAAGLFDPRRRLSEDYELWLRMAHGGRVVLLNEPYVVYATGGVSSQLWAMERGELETYRILWNEGMIGLADYEACRLWSLARFLARTGSVEHGRRLEGR
ncbi:MAG: glycosyltransferase family A protein [Rectinemataceae bacterium]|jgi:glycosyltransferase involved in cell wall biosynthesis